MLLLLLLLCALQPSVPLSLPTPPTKNYDVLIFGSGPTSLSLASLLTSSSSPPTVAIVSKDFSKPWIPNYGAWETEWSTISNSYDSKNVKNLSTLGVDHRWPDTSCYFNEGPPSESRVNVGASYIRVSRAGLKECFTDNKKYSVVEENHVARCVAPNVYEDGEAVVFDGEFTSFKLSGGTSISGKIIIDGTGAESTLTLRDKRENEGYQIAYGVEASVKGEGVGEDRVGDYERDKMTLFDYRIENFKEKDKVTNQPTFMYVMPLKSVNNSPRIFFEETSLVARPGVSFRACKSRLHERLKGMGVEVDEVFEEEFCYIPMGGEVARKGQRIVAVGAAGGLVHPSTGYQICRR
ncbi:hypothetical protein TL16_g10674 [Triparma laevis f. inornata]|uniref:FAD/NAD(P)-binding domain-containing protein n=1 Tax=Triparma laevis f. inornata TaxID=1714386 RepID=A0A9W7BAI7_9STRA|nr:hypothetical protein TL16_g10674 [Triparma laevis f. inornata]